MRRMASRIDYPMILILLCFMVISTIVIHSATQGTRYEGLHMNNLIMYGLFFLPMLTVALLDYRLLLKYGAYALYAAGIGLLLVVLNAGVHLNGSTRWIHLGFIQFQPSELVKLSAILLIAKLLGRRDGEPPKFMNDIVPVIAVTLLPAALILMQPDLGTAIIFIGMMIGMLWIAKIRWLHILIGLTAAAGAAAALVGLYFWSFETFSKIVKPHQMARIQAFLDPASDPDKSWHVINSIRAIGTGKLFGKGYQQGSIVQNGYIPYDYADSIFVVIGEEFGFVGSAVVLLLYFFLIYRMVLIAHESSDIAGTYIIVGVVSMLVLQIFENIAMHLGMMPLTGIALPFVSYGGSSLLTNMLSVGLVLSVKIYSSRQAQA